MNTDNSGHGTDHSGLRHFREGGSFEDQAGYSRAVRSGRLIAVSGTTCRPEFAARDTRAQTEDCLRRVIAAVERLGGGRTDIVRTRLFLTPDADWQTATSVHREMLGDVAPANTTLFVHALIGPDLLVEVEAEAWVSGPGGASEATGATGTGPATGAAPGPGRNP
jgi:enamine deaminase RidA (YjgF/YER057c/UK114 family)